MFNQLDCGNLFTMYKYIKISQCIPLVYTDFFWFFFFGQLFLSKMGGKEHWGLLLRSMLTCFKYTLYSQYRKFNHLKIRAGKKIFILRRKTGQEIFFPLRSEICKIRNSCLFIFNLQHLSAYKYHVMDKCKNIQSV